MKILIFNWQDITNPLAGGAEVHLHEVFERIAGMGHQVTLVCHRYRSSPRTEIRNGITIFRFGDRFLFNFYVPFLYLFNFRWKSFDIVIDDVNKIPFFTPLFVRRPIHVVTHHLFGKSIFLETSFPLAAYVYLSERLIKIFYRRKRFIIGSPSTRDEYIRWGFDPTRVVVINYCVNHSTYYPDINNNYKVYLIGYFGRLKKYKCVDHLLEAFKIARESVNPDIRLRIIGEGDDRSRLENVAEKLQIRDFVEFLGFVEEKEKASLLQEMNFVVNTSSKEGWGLTVIEANACGVPVIAADVQGLRDSVIDGETGLLYPFGDVNILAEKVEYLLKEKEIRDALRARAIEWARSFDWDRAAMETVQQLEETISEYSGMKNDP